MTISVDAKHIALAGSPQCHFDIANPVDAIGCHPAERRRCCKRAFDHFQRDGRLGCE